jgi:DNA (cytosine-5)-methyltransferase 1
LSPNTDAGNASIPVVDIFAGPGGLNEGFSSFEAAGGRRPFSIRLSIEMDRVAHLTLTLRAFFRQFPPGRAPAAYYEFVRDTATPLEERLKRLFDSHPAEAERATAEARCAELGKHDPGVVRGWIEAGLRGAEDWVLIGGPPCQAYSLAGRSRNKGIEDYVPEDDERQTLYVEYLQIIAEHRPAAFVMENVKGLLSATLNDERIFERICEDLQNPHEALRREGRRISVRRDSAKGGRALPQRYRLYSLIDYAGAGKSYSLFPSDDIDQELKLGSFVVRMERHGIPQARHRVIILGIREDFNGVVPGRLGLSARVNAERVLAGLPRLRGGLSREPDGFEEWTKCLRAMAGARMFEAVRRKGGENVLRGMTEALGHVGCEEMGRGGEFVPCEPSVDYRHDWFIDRKLEGVCNHSTRAHIRADLHRYFYAACFAAARGSAPHLKDFPDALLPAHANVASALDGNNFSDRFRVQLAGRPSTTVTSHIAKDGHYYIHYDPTQCRSLTVREAARLQTFPDNYFFCGPRTSQFIQVGNAVPPLLASQIGTVVFNVMKRAGVVR